MLPWSSCFQLYCKVFSSHCPTSFDLCHSNDTNLHHLFVSWTLWSVICTLLSDYQPPLCQSSVILFWSAFLGTLNLLPVLLHLPFLITPSEDFWRIPQTRQSWSGQWDTQKFWGECKLEVVLDTPAGRVTIHGEPRQTERDHMNFSTGKCRFCPGWHRAKPCTSTGWEPPKETWSTKLVMSQPYTLEAKKGINVVTDWKEMHSEGIKFQFLQVVKIQLCKSLSNLV